MTTMTGHPDVTNAELRGIGLLAALQEQELARVQASLRLVRLAEGETLFDFGQPAKRFFYVRRGEIKLYRLSPEGAEKVIEIIHPGETFAEAVMFMERRDGYPVSAQALTEAEVIAFDNETFLALLRGSPDTCFRVLASLSRRLRTHVDEIHRLTLHNATFRLVTYLLQQIPEGVVQSPEIQLTTPKHVIASRLGIQPETFSRILARLSRENMIEVHGHSIVLRDIDSLRALLTA